MALNGLTTIVIVIIQNKTGIKLIETYIMRH